MLSVLRGPKPSQHWHSYKGRRGRGRRGDLLDATFGTQGLHHTSAAARSIRQLAGEQWGVREIKLLFSLICLCRMQKELASRTDAGDAAEQTASLASGKLPQNVPCNDEHAE